MELLFQASVGIFLLVQLLLCRLKIFVGSFSFQLGFLELIFQYSPEFLMSYLRLIKPRLSLFKLPGKVSYVASVECFHVTLLYIQPLQAADVPFRAAH